MGVTYGWVLTTCRHIFIQNHALMKNDSFSFLAGRADIRRFDRYIGQGTKDWM